MFRIPEYDRSIYSPTALLTTDKRSEHYFDSLIATRFNKNGKQHHHLYSSYGRWNSYRQHGIFGNPVTAVHREDTFTKRIRRVFHPLQINRTTGSYCFYLPSHTDWDRSLLSTGKLHRTDGVKTRILQPLWSETDLRCRCFFFKYLPDIQPSSSNRQPGSITRKQKSCPENDPANKKNDCSHSGCIFFSCFFWNLASKILNKA